MENPHSFHDHLCPPRFFYIPLVASPNYVTFCWSELLLYKNFCSLPDDIGTTSFEINSHWHHIKDTYLVWHVDRLLEDPSTPPFDDSTSDPIPFPFPPTMVKWEILSQIHPGNDIHIDDL